MLEKYFKGFPEKQALKGTAATVLSYKGTKWISNMIGEKMSKDDSSKRPMYEFIGSVGSLLASIFAYTKLKSKDIGFGLVLGAGVNLIDKFFLLPQIKKNIPETMQPLFAGPNDVDISHDDYMRRVNDARYGLSEDDVKAVVNAARVNGYLAGFENDHASSLGEDVIVITPEERAALIDAQQMHGLEGFDEEMGAYDPTHEEYEYPEAFAGISEEEFA